MTMHPTLKAPFGIRLLLGIPLLASTLMASGQARAALTEEGILQSFRAQSAGKQRNSSERAGQELGANLFEEQFQARLISKYSLTKSNETPVSAFQPVFSPAEDFSLGVQKKFGSGVSAEVAGFMNQTSTSNGTVQDATQVGLRIQAQVDLWKNLLGRLDQAQLQSFASRKARASHQEHIANRQMEVNLRKAYWSLVATTESLSLSRELLKSAETQLAEARRRQKAGAADVGEVARYQSQVSSRKAAVLLFQYEESQVKMALASALGEEVLRDQAIPPQQSTIKIPEINACISSIRSQGGVPSEATRLDEVIALLKEETSAEIKAAEAHSKMELALVGQYQTTGVSNSYSKASDELTAKKESGSAIGLQLSIPLGEASRNSQRSLLMAKEQGLSAQALSLQNEMASLHTSMKEAIGYLYEGLGEQVNNSKSLQTSYQEMKRKYQQGRVGVSTLIMEQDALFQSELQEISLKRQIAHAVLDYFSVFTEYPCGWNQI